MLQPRLTKVEPIAPLKLRLKYETGEVKLFDVSPYATGSWYGELKNEPYFRTVHLLPGGIGTLDECVETLILESRWKPAVLWNLDGYYDGLKDFFCRARAEGLLSQQWDFAPWFCETTEEIWTALERTE